MTAQPVHLFQEQLLLFHSQIGISPPIMGAPPGDLGPLSRHLDAELAGKRGLRVLLTGKASRHVGRRPRTFQPQKKPPRLPQAGRSPMYGYSPT